MEIERGLIDEAWTVKERIKKFGRTLDILLIPTSFVRTVMRVEDGYLSDNEWRRKNRYPEESRARWTFPVAYSIGGTLESARLALYLYGVYEFVNNLL